MKSLSLRVNRDTIQKDERINETTRSRVPPQSKSSATKKETVRSSLCNSLDSIHIFANLKRGYVSR